MGSEWISVKEAAAIVGCSAPYFREIFCRTKHPLVAIRVKPCPSGRRRMLVLLRSVRDIVEPETIEPRQKAICHLH